MLRPRAHVNAANECSQAGGVMRRRAETAAQVIFAAGFAGMWLLALVGAVELILQARPYIRLGFALGVPAILIAAYGYWRTSRNRPGGAWIMFAGVVGVNAAFLVAVTLPR